MIAPREPEARRGETMRASAIMLAFGMSILAFLVAIDRPQWFHLRPASGTAAAMSNASTTAAQHASETAHAAASDNARTAEVLTSAEPS